MILAAGVVVVVMVVEESNDNKGNSDLCIVYQVGNSEGRFYVE